MAPDALDPFATRIPLIVALTAVTSGLFTPMAEIFAARADRRTRSRAPSRRLGPSSEEFHGFV